MSDLGSHMNDLPFWALKLKAPRTIEAFGPPPHPEIAPASMHAVYEYDARGDMPPVRLTWYQGEDKPEAWTNGAIPNPQKWNDGMLFIGTKGMMLANHQKHVLLPEKDFKDFKRPEPFLPKSLGHWAEWVHACKTGAPTHEQLRVRRLAHRGQPPGQRRLPRRQEARVGPRPHVRHQRPRGRTRSSAASTARAGRSPEHVADSGSVQGQGTAHRITRRYQSAARRRLIPSSFV